MINYFDVLNISEDAEIEVIKAAYKALVKKYHPDNTDIPREIAEEKMALINEAYDVLSDNNKRMEYIKKLKSEACIGPENDNRENEKKGEATSSQKKDVNKKANRKAIMSLLLGIISWVGISTIIIPFVCGIWSIVDGIQAYIGKTKYKKCAIGGCTLSILFFVILVWGMTLPDSDSETTKVEDVQTEIYQSEDNILNDTEVISDDVIVETETSIVDEQEKEIQNADKESDVVISQNMEQMPIYSFEYLNAYIEVNGIDVPVVKKKTQMEKALTNDSEMVSLKTSDVSWGDGIEYSITNEQTELQYVGELKNNKPHGWGRIIKLVSANEYEDTYGEKIGFDDYYEAWEASDVYMVLVYVGQFKDGSYDGYGWEYITPFTSRDDLMNSIYARSLGDDYVKISNDIQQNILNTCNPVGYMGEFKKGEYHGDGIMIQYPIREIPIDMTISEQESLFGARLDREIVLYIGEYKDGQRNGICKEYMFGKLLYSGTIENGEYNKKGTLYYVGSDQKKYEGEWRTGYYHGKGTLYKEDGSVEYKGKWEMGDYDN